MNFFSLEGKVAWVTGGLSGIGEAIVQRFIQAGAKVCVVDLKEAKPSRSDDLRLDLQMDVSDEPSLIQGFKQAYDHFGKLDIIVNNAGIQPLGVSFQEMSVELLNKTFQVNVNSVALGIKHAQNYLKAGGRIINMGSFIGVYASPQSTAYAASKAAVSHLSKCAALELASKGITVNSVCPGTVKTPAVLDIPNNPEIPFVESKTPLGRLADPEEIASCVHFLASDEASYVTGHALHCDGGITAGWKDYDLVAPDQYQNGIWKDQQ